MSRAKLLIVACFAAFALSAMASATASAGEWDVGGSPLVGSAALASTALVLSHGVLEAVGVKVECLAHEVGISGGKLIAPDGILATSITFKECGANLPCKVPAEISTLPAHGLAQLEPILNTLILVLPETKKTFVTIPFTGENCALLGNQPVTGHVDILIHGGLYQALLHLVLIFSLPKGLFVGSSEAKLEGLDVDLKLASNKEWNFL